MSHLTSGPASIVVNLRSASAGLTGVQRYSAELCARLNGRVATTRPVHSLHGIAGHLWEQTILPTLVGKRLLWSPANTGPLIVERQVVTIHDVAPLDHPEWFDSRFSKWYGWMIPRLARRIRRFITVSEFSKTRLMANTDIDESRITVIPNGVSDRFYPRDGDTVTRLLSRINIPVHKYLLAHGSIEPRKNLCRLLQAWELAAPRLPKETWLVVSGAKGQRRVFASTDYCRPTRNVHWAGFVRDDDLPALYSGALALLYPSVYEGFGLPVLESMACGTPVIAANSASLPEVAGDASVLVDPYDVDAMADSVVQIVHDRELRNRLVSLGAERSCYFTWDRTADSTYKTLRSAAAN